jgi:hypothetical protein
MMVLVGFAVGYVVGAQAGREGLARLLESWKTVQESEEFAGLVETGRSLLTNALHSAVEMGAGEMKDAVKSRIRAA